MTKQLQRYKLLSDDDGHYYIIPVEKTKQFRRWVDAAPYWEGYREENFEGRALGGSPSLLTFTDPQVE
jgi:hypothetical protein